MLEHRAPRVVVQQDLQLPRAPRVVQQCCGEVHNLFPKRLNMNMKRVSFVWTLKNPYEGSRLKKLFFVYDTFDDFLWGGGVGVPPIFIQKKFMQKSVWIFKPFFSKWPRPWD